MASKSQASIFFVFIITTTLLLASNGDPQVPCYFIFGDSLMDNGNNNHLHTKAKVNFEPYGIDFPDGPTGRFSNGRNIADVIAQLLGFESFIQPFATARSDDIVKGVNYASGGAGIREESGQHMSFFDIGRNTPDWPAIENGLSRYCANRYAGNKYRLHAHFNKHGGLEDVDTARRNPPLNVNPEPWNKLIDDIFLNEQWQHRAKKNSENRAKLPYCSFHGSRSYVSTRFKKMNPETQKIQGSIDNWRNMHYKPTTGWVNEKAKDDYDKLVAELEKTQNASSSSNSLNEQEIFKKVFGERRGHNVGVGRKLKRQSGFPSSSTASTPTSDEVTEDMVRVAQEAWERHHEEVERKRYQDLAEFFSSMIPNCNMANLPPFVSTPAPPFDYKAYKASQASSQSRADDNEEDFGDDEED